MLVEEIQVRLILTMNIFFVVVVLHPSFFLCFIRFAALSPALFCSTFMELSSISIHQGAQFRRQSCHLCSWQWEVKNDPPNLLYQQKRHVPGLLVRPLKHLYPFTGQWLQYVPPGSTRRISTFYPHSIFMCFVSRNKQRFLSYSASTD